jgi:ribosome-binding protein aMBF1 (putative translation factor)
MEMQTIHREGHKLLVRSIINARKDAELFQHDVAKKLGRHQSWVAKIEKGQRRIDMLEFLDLARVIGFDAAKMLAKIARIERANLKR